MTATFRRALGQRFNPAGILFTGSVALREPCLFLPHLSVRDMRSLDWAALRQVGFRGVVLDKDNTLTEPYSRSLWPPLADSLRECVEAFPGQVAVFSNSAGLTEYDPDGSEARSLEESIEGIRVIRHEAKKPSGSAEEIERFFGCSASQLLMIGDRYFTDVAYGNKNGFLTILTEPLCLSKEPIVVQQVRKFESFLVNLWNRKGLKPVQHPLQCEAEKCVKFLCN
ncbi:haloacid dehalogenase (HAD) superfamily protein [Carex rostrata]